MVWDVGSHACSTGADVARHSGTPDGHGPLRGSCSRRLLCSAIILALTAWPAMALGDGVDQFTSRQNQHAIRIVNDQAPAGPAVAQHSSPASATPTPPDDPFVIANDFLARHVHELGVQDPAVELSPYASTSDRVGMQHVRYHQMHGGVPVFGSEVLVHLDSNGNVRSANGRVALNIAVDTNGQVVEAEAIRLAKQHWADQFGEEEPEVVRAKLYVFNPGLYGERGQGAYYLAWEVHLALPESRLDELFYVDAHTGALLHQHTGLRTADNPHPVDRSIWDCSLADVGPSGCGRNYSYHVVYTDFWYTFGCSEGNCPRGPNPFDPPYAGTTDTDDLYYLLGHIHDYLWLKFERSGGNGRGGISDGVTSVVTHGPFSRTNGWTYLDAIGNSCEPVAGFGYHNVQFCLGAIVTDLVAHEYGHSLTYYLSFNPDNTWNSMVYYGETGALTENMSDILGEGVENWLHGENDWIFVVEPHLGGPYRDLADPKSIPRDPPYPDRFHDPDFYCGTIDNGGLHINAGVMNKASYLVAMGGSFNGCTVEGLGLEKMLQIWYRAVAYYYTPTSTFNDAYYALIDACNDLYGPADCAEVVKALQSVEIDQPGTCSGLPGEPPACAGSTPGTPVPTVSEWGMVLFALLILTGGTLVFRRHMALGA